ncbi:MAG: pyrroloquinoline quinone-dependent dehydrogenase, partial [Myxococcales bacterium]|nr:pyrroloquinoline quinone-dependent dehydrogenase [Myxococcales bacterium]
ALATGTAGCDGGHAPRAAGGPVADWPAYGGSHAGTRHSPLTQIDRSNVDALEVAWEFHTGDVSTEGHLATSFQATPTLVGDTLYVCTPRNRVIALDPETGEERWRYDARLDSAGMYVITCRGVSHWSEPAPVAGRACQRRVFMGTLDARLVALDADTGKPCLDFGDQGEIDLREGVGDTYPGEYGVTSPPTVVGDRLVTGALVLDNIRTDAPGGVVRAYDVRTGDKLWAWDPVAPGTPPERDADGNVHYARGTTNAWTTFAADPALGLVYVPTGNTSPDYYGGHRNGSDYYSSSVVALDAATGAVRWHFQTVHHDVWDYDVPSQPALFDWPGPDGPVPALAQATKLGHVFFLDRRTGEPLWPVEERPVPQGALPGEVLSPTQPFPTRPAPIHPAKLEPDDAFGFTFWDRGRCREQIESMRSEGIFTPPSTQGSIHFPGMVGGSNWGSLTIDPERGLLVANSTRVATWVKSIPREEYARMEAAGELVPGRSYEPATGTPYVVTREFLASPFGAPCNPPPWGVLTAIDLRTGERRWEVPLGSTRDMAPWPLWLELGVPNQGGSITTASGLVFVAATTDDFLRAFDVETGEKLWQARLPAGGQATPMTYRLRPDGRQYVVIAAGGHGLLHTTPGDSVVAYALP